MKWYDYEKRGWSWSLGFNPNYGGYYAQAYRDLPKRPDGTKGWVRINGHKVYRECLIEGGCTIDEARDKLHQRLDSIDSLKDS